MKIIVIQEYGERGIRLLSMIYRTLMVRSGPIGELIFTDRGVSWLPIEIEFYQDLQSMTI